MVRFVVRDQVEGVETVVWRLLSLAARPGVAAPGLGFGWVVQ
jgi:hypothetical protein